MKRIWQSASAYLQAVSGLFIAETEIYKMVTAKYETRDVRWAPDGKGMVLMDKDRFCCAFEVEDSEDV